VANAQQIIDVKGTDLAWLPPTATALEAAQLMNDRHIGSVVVILDGQLVGIFTERDVMRRIVSTGRDPGATRLYDVMTSPVAVAAPHTTLDELRAAMRDKRIRHVPVVDGEEVTGMVSIGDLNRAQHDVDVLTIRYLEQYISVP
jgi:CBS domain-containing protein